MIAALALIAVVWRVTLLSGRGIPFADAAISQTLAEGVSIYLRAFSNAAFGVFAMGSALGIALSFAVLAAFVVWSVRVLIFPVERKTLEAYCVGLALWLACLVLHAPIALQNLGGAALASYGPSLRVFHLALAAPLVMACAPLLNAMHGVRMAVVRLIIFCAMGLVAAASIQSNQFVRQWVTETNGPTKTVVTSTVKLIVEQSLPDMCKIVVSGASTIAPDFLAASDVMIKAMAPIATHNLLRCVLVTERSPHFALVHKDVCSRDHWLPLRPVHPLVQPHVFGKLCYEFFTTPDRTLLSNDPRTVWINTP